MINNFTIITSNSDNASNTMKELLIENEKFEKVKECEIDQNYNFNEDFQIYNSKNHSNIELITTDKSLIELDNLDNITPRDSMIIFLSKHVSKSKTPTLTSHSTGNFSESILWGGKPNEIGNTFPSFQKLYMKKIHEKKDEVADYDLMIEATHHGPTSPVNPMLFIEIGSSEIQWNDKNTASFVCKCVIETVKSITDKTNQNTTDIGIGIGGNHYPQKFNKLILFSNVAFGPIISKYNLAFINEKMISQIKMKSVEKVKNIYIDEKGLGKEKEKVLNLLRNQDLDTIFV
ncbi:MAG: D-aminoacyl-tRNA deacylase [Candidatus Nitrosocosmicus sp.]